MKTLFGSLLILSLSGLAVAECERPAAPTLPDGATAEMAAMAAGQGEVKAFVAAGNAYLECLKAEADALGEEEKSAAEARLASYNSMVDEMQAVATEFNTQIKAFKARQ